MGWKDNFSVYHINISIFSLNPMEFTGRFRVVWTPGIPTSESGANTLRRVTFTGIQPGSSGKWRGNFPIFYTITLIKVEQLWQAKVMILL